MSKKLNIFLTVIIAAFVLFAISCGSAYDDPDVIHLNADPKILTAPCQTATITATVFSDKGCGLTGEIVTFNVSDNGFLTYQEGYCCITDDEGKVSVQVGVNPGVTSGTIRVTAMVDDIVSDIDISLSFDPTPAADNMILTADPVYIINEHGETAETMINAVIYDQTNMPMPNILVSFSAANGFLSAEEVVTDGGGSALVTAYTTATSGVLTVTATAEGLTRTVTVPIYGDSPWPPDPKVMILNAEPPYLINEPGNVVQTNISGIIYDQGNRPVPNVLVHFPANEVQNGWLNVYSAVSDSNGMVHVTAFTDDADVTIRVKGVVATDTKDSFFGRKEHSHLKRFAPVSKSSVEAFVDIPVYKAEVPEVRNMIMTADPSWLINQEGETAETDITATVYNQHNLPVPNILVEFTVTNGLISATHAVTDSNGQINIKAFTTETSGFLEVHGTVQADSKEKLSFVSMRKSTDKNITASVVVPIYDGAPPQADKIIVTADPTYIESEPGVIKSTNITARIYNSNNDPVTNVLLQFSVDAGDAWLDTQFAITDHTGMASVTAYTTATNGMITISATYQAINLSGEVDIPIYGPTSAARLFLTSDPAYVVHQQGEISEVAISAKVYDDNWHPVQNALVSFVEISNFAALPVNHGITDQNGEITINAIIACANFVLCEEELIVIADAGFGIDDTINIPIYPELIAPSLIDLSASPAYLINPHGSIGEFTATAVVYNEMGVPVPNIPVTFTVTDGYPAIYQTITDSSGIAVVNVHTSINDGMVTVKADCLGVLADLHVPVYSDELPEVSNMILTADPAYIINTQGETAETEISGIIYDQYNNPVPNVLVTLTVDNGWLNAYQAVSNASGTFNITAYTEAVDGVLKVTGTIPTNDKTYMAKVQAKDIVRFVEIPVYSDELPEVERIILTADPAYLINEEGSIAETVITGIVYDNANNPVPNAFVTFTSDNGWLNTYQAVSNESGIVTITAYTQETDAVISITGTITIDPVTLVDGFVDVPVYSEALPEVRNMVLTADPAYLINEEGGIAETVISGTIYDDNNNPVPNAFVTFTSDNGWLNAYQAVSNASGVVTITAYTQEIDVVMTVTGTVLTGAKTSVTAFVDVPVYSEALPEVKNLILTADPAYLINEEGSIAETVITGTVYDNNYDPVPNVFVTFTAENGWLNAYQAVTNASGILTITAYTPEIDAALNITGLISVDGADDITALVSVPVYGDSLPVVSNLILESDPAYLVNEPGGLVDAAITGIVYDQNNDPVSNVLVTLSADNGWLNAYQAVSDANGVFTVRAYTEEYDDLMTVTGVIESGEKTKAMVKQGVVTGSVVVPIYYQAPPEISYILMSSDPVYIESEPGQVKTAHITAVVYDEDNNPVPHALLKFEVPTGNGIIDNHFAVTDQAGQAAVTAYTSATDGVMTVTATYGPTGLAGNVMINIYAPSAAAHLFVSSTPAYIEYEQGQVIEAEITARVYDEYFNPVKNVFITFETSIGHLYVNNGITDINGELTVNFHTNDPDYADKITITANAGFDVQGDVDIIIYYEPVPEVARTIITSDPLFIQSETGVISQAVVTAEVYDTEWELVENVPVRFMLSILDINGDVIPGVLPVPDIVNTFTDINGEAVITVYNVDKFTGDILYDGRIAIQAIPNVEASAGGYHEIPIYGQEPPAVSNLTITADPAYLINEVGEIAETTVSGMVYDQYNNPVPNALLTMSVEDASDWLSTDSVVTDGSGAYSVIAYTPATSGVLRVTATYAPSGLDKTVAVPVYSEEPPEVSNMILTAEPAYIVNEEGNTASAEITGIIYDQYGDTVSNAVVTFSVSDNGWLNAYQAVSDESGAVNITVYTSAIDGVITVTGLVPTGGVENFSATVIIPVYGEAAPVASNLVLAAEPPYLMNEPGDNTVETVISGIVYDQNNDPVPNVLVNFEVDNGWLGAYQAVSNAAGEISVTAYTMIYQGYVTVTGTVPSGGKIAVKADVTGEVKVPVYYQAPQVSHTVVTTDPLYIQSEPGVVSQAVITTKLYDAQWKLVPNVMVRFMLSVLDASGNTIPGVYPVPNITHAITNANGEATFIVYNLNNVSGDIITDGRIAIQATPLVPDGASGYHELPVYSQEPPEVDNMIFTADPAYLVNNTGEVMSVDISGIVYDQHNDPISNALISFSVEPGDHWLSADEAVSDASGSVNITAYTLAIGGWLTVTAEYIPTGLSKVISVPIFSQVPPAIDAISMIADPAYLIYEEGEILHTNITGIAYDQFNNPVPNALLSLSVQSAEDWVTPDHIMTDGSGMFSVTAYTPATGDELVVTAAYAPSALNKSITIPIYTVEPPKAARLVLTADPAYIINQPGDHIVTTQITGIVYDEKNDPVPNVLVEFEVDEGWLNTYQAVSDGSGTVSVTAYTTAYEGVLTVTGTITEIGKGIRITKDIVGEVAIPVYYQVPSVSYTTVTSDPLYIISEPGVASSAQVMTTLYDTAWETVPNVMVRFMLYVRDADGNPIPGVLPVPNVVHAMTDASGQTTFSFNNIDYNTGDIINEGRIAIQAIPLVPEAANGFHEIPIYSTDLPSVDSLIMTADPAYIINQPGDNIVSTTITGIVRDEMNNPVPNVLVDFTPDNGWLNVYQAVSDASGIVTVTAYTTAHEGVLKVTGQIPSSKAVEGEVIIPIYYQAPDVAWTVITSDPLYINHEPGIVKEAEVITKLYDEHWELVPNVMVRFMLSVRDANGNTIPGIMPVPNTVHAMTDANGQTTFNVMNVDYNSGDLITDGRIAVQAMPLVPAGANGYHEIPVYSGMPPAISSITLTADPAYLINEEGSIAETGIAGIAYDQNNNPVPNAMVAFEVENGWLNRYEAVTDGSGAFDVNAYTMETDGVLRLTVICTISGHSKSIPVPIYSEEPPEVRNLILKADPAYLVNNTGEMMEVNITGTVYDQYNNPVPNILVTFSVTPNGMLNVLQAVSDGSGVVNVTAYTDATSGMMIVTGVAPYGLENYTATVPVPIYSADPPEVSIFALTADPAYLINEEGSIAETTISGIAFDQNNDPMPNTLVSFEVDNAGDWLNRYEAVTDGSGAFDVNAYTMQTDGILRLTVTCAISGHSNSIPVPIYSEAPPEVRNLILKADPAYLINDTGEMMPVNISGTVYDQYNNPVPNILVTFSVSPNGWLDVYQAVSDASGVVDITAYTDATSGVLRVTGVAPSGLENYTATVPVPIYSEDAPVVTMMTLIASPPYIVHEPGQIHETQITGMVYDQNYIPVADALVVLDVSDNGGLNTYHAISAADGSFSFTAWTAGVGDELIVSGLVPLGGAENVISTVVIPIYHEDPPEVSNTMIVTQPHFIESEPGIIKDISITATVYDDAWNPVPNVPVRFTALPVNGKMPFLSILNGVTNASGEVETTLYNVCENIGEIIIDGSITVQALPLTAPAAARDVIIPVFPTGYPNEPAIIQLVSDPQYIVNAQEGNVESADITAMVYDIDGFPIDNIPVIFEIVNGHPPVYQAITSGGSAEMTLFTTNTHGIITVTATAGAISNTLEIPIYSGMPTLIDMTGPSYIINETGIAESSASVRVLDEHGFPIRNLPVTFTLTNAHPSVYHTITDDSDGVAGVNFHTTATFGNVTITADAGFGVTQTIEIPIYSGIPTLIDITSVPTYITNVPGGVAEATVTAIVYDQHGLVISLLPVRFEITSGNGHPPLYNTITDTSGTATLELNTTAAPGDYVDIIISIPAFPGVDAELNIPVYAP